MFKISKFSKIFLFLFLSLLLFLPFFVSAVTFTPEVGIQGEGTYAITKGVGYEMGTNPGDTIFKYFGAIYSWGIRAVGIIAVVMMMVAGFQWMSAGGNAQAVAAAKGRMMNALMGLILIIGAYWLLSFINPALVQAPNLNIKEAPKAEEINVAVNSECPSGYTTLGASTADTDEAKAIKHCQDVCDARTRDTKISYVAEVKAATGGSMSGQWGKVATCCKCSPASGGVKIECPASGQPSEYKYSNVKTSCHMSCHEIKCISDDSNMLPVPGNLCQIADGVSGTAEKTPNELSCCPCRCPSGCHLEY